MKRILFVNDDIQWLELLRAVIEPDYRVDISTDPKDVLDRVTDDDYVLIVLDKKMPMMDGMDLARALRPKLKKTVLGLMTGHGYTQELIKAHREGLFQEYFAKEDPTTLKRQVQIVAR